MSANCEQGETAQSTSELLCKIMVTCSEHTEVALWRDRPVSVSRIGQGRGKMVHASDGENRKKEMNQPWIDSGDPFTSGGLPLPGVKVGVYARRRGE